MDREYLVEKLILFLHFCGFLCFHGVRIGPMFSGKDGLTLTGSRSILKRDRMAVYTTMRRIIKS